MMMVVRNMMIKEAAETIVDNSDEIHAVAEEPPIEEFSVADYYLVRGNKIRFKIYPLTKKRGKITAGVAGCIYDSAKNPIVLWNDADRNAAVIKKDIKLETIISFAAMMLKINMSEIYQYNRLAETVGVEIGETISLYDLLKMLSSLSA